MRFDDFDKKMRKYEESVDVIIPKDMYIVARLDGRSFSRLTQKKGYEKPFDDMFHILMIGTTCDLMKNSGFRIIYGYTESDEISLLFHPEENSFGRKTRKINTALASRASAFLSLGTNEPVSFDCRTVPLPDIDSVKDYFFWRREDSNRNSLNGWCYWTLRQEGKSKREAASILNGIGVTAKKELLMDRLIDYEDIPLWQKFGTGIYYIDVEKVGYDPVAKKETRVNRRKLTADLKLPVGKKYGEFIADRIAAEM